MSTGENLAKVLCDPVDWPRKYRRAFVVTLPLSLPLWLAVVTMFLLVCGFAYIIAKLGDLWE